MVDRTTDTVSGLADALSVATAGVTQLAECQPSKLAVVGSSPIARSV